METSEKKILEALLDYHDENVISRFLDLYDIDESEAKDILKETLKFLSISHISAVYIPDDLLILDEMWHNMILFTPEYHEFSQKFFNRYIHHVPAKKRQKVERQYLLKIKPDQAKKEYLDKIHALIAVVYDHLGEETVKKWFQDYPKKYSIENIKKLRK